MPKQKLNFKGIKSIFLLIALVVIFFYTNEVHAIPMAPPMCEIQATINRIEKISKNNIVGDIKIFSSIQSNDLADCSKFSGKVLDGVKIGAYAENYKFADDLVVGQKVKAFLMIKTDEYYLDSIKTTDKFSGTGSIVNKDSLRTSVYMLVLLILLVVILFAIFLLIEKLSQKRKK